MKGNAEIVDLLNDLLTNELTATNQYLAQSRMCANWGYERLAAKLAGDSQEEQLHASWIIERILFLEGDANLARYHELKIGSTVREQLENDLRLEYDAIAALRKTIAAARDANDNGTEDLAMRILVTEEEDAHWIEAQLEQIRQVGEQNYLAQQLRA